MGYPIQRFAIILGNAADSINWGFRAPRGTYDDIASDLGVTPIVPSDQVAIVYGCNSPKPARVSIAYRFTVSANLSFVRRVKRFADYEKLNDLMFGVANNKTVSVIDPGLGVVSKYPIENITMAS